ncbi:MAG TPA: SDR family NAD(P)-dependent oxidoreductase [Propionibacteriaceae bacterium]
MFEIAIVGIGCRFPGGATNPAEFWDFLVAKRDGISEIPADRWSVEKFYDPDPDAPGRMYTRHGGFIAQSPWDFDPDYFGISAREAAIMDPQQRLLLEVAVEALDDAGLGGRVGGRDVGVYVGGFTSDNQGRRHAPAARAAINSHTATSGTFTMLSNRLSYVLDLHGPSMTIDTACSSSLVAIHEAAQAVARGECEIALAGGVNMMLAPETFISMCKGRFLARDGHCKTFDATADGYARGEGSGVVVLKPLAAAQVDGDRVYAVVRATGANQDGRTSGITVPNPVAQAALAARVLAESGQSAADVGYVEAHGTGTSIGDPLEIAALGATYGNVPGRHTPLVVGSVKAAIGHLEAAAGVAGVIKAALTLHHHQVAPQAWLNELNPAIPFEQHRIEIPTEVDDFPAGYTLPTVAVNGFGYGGTNAHVIMVAAPAFNQSVPAVAPSAEAGSPVRVLPISGRTDTAVRAAAGALADQVGRGLETGPVDVPAVQAGAWGRRLHHPVRTALTWTDADDLLAQLRALESGAGRPPVKASADGERPVFVFSGMGPQWWGMARDLLTRDTVFARTAAEIDEVFVGISGWSIVAALLAAEADSAMNRTQVAQPANFLVQVALTAELAALGVEPAAILGHSVGEVSAAYLSGVLSLHDALLVSCHRARLQAKTAGTGGMLAVGLPEDEALAWLADPAYAGQVSIAAINSPSSVTLAGDTDAVASLAARLADGGVFARALRVEVPYHSHLMDPILGEIRETLAPITAAVPSLPLYSSVTASPVTGADWDAGYWVDNVRQPVRFAAAVQALVADGHRVFLEIGPHPVLGGNIREILVRSGETGAVVSTLNRTQPDTQSLAQTIADLYVAGALATDRLPGSTGPVPHVELPAYPWQRTRLWTEVAENLLDRLGDPVAPPLLGVRAPGFAPEWQTELSVTALPWLRDHVVDGLVLLPGAGFIDAALSAAAALMQRSGQALADITFLAPRIVDDHDVPVLRLTVEPTTRRFTIDSRSAGDELWATNVTGRLVDADYVPGSHDLSLPPDAHHIVGPELYSQLGARGLQYGPQFQGIQEAWSGRNRLVATVDASSQASSRHLVHPATTDAALQCVAALIADAQDAPTGPMVPYAVAAVRRHAPLASTVTVAVRRLDRPGLWADIALADPEGNVALELLGVEFRPVRPEAAALTQLAPLWYELGWERLGVPTAAPSQAMVGTGSLVVVTSGDATPSVARELLTAHRSAHLVSLSASADAMLAGTGLPAESEPPEGALLVTAVREAIESVAAAGLGRVTIAVVPPVSDPAAPVEEAAVDAAALLLATARAVQTVLDDRVLDGVVLAGAVPVCGVVVTQHAFGVPGDVGTGQPSRVQLGHAALIGARRALRNEQPDLSWRQVDSEADTPAGQLAAEVFVDEDPAVVADEIVLRGGVRLVIALQRNLAEHLDPLEVPRALTDPEASFVVEAPSSFLLSDLALREVPRITPGPDQVEVRVLSAGLNYKDSAKILGLLTARELAGTYYGTDLGMEAIGVVVRTGPGVTRFAVGDRLSIGTRDSLRRYLTVDLDRGGAVSMAPTPWADTDSALNLPFLTAHHSLADAARLRSGETVLIQGAAGGVGLAAIQVARCIGATVIGTASSPSRRAAVLAAGADHVLDSRSLNFVADVRELTGGLGVDVVLNSAPGEVIGANLEVAAEFGRIVEIGKADIYTGGLLALAPFDRNLSFIAVDIDRMFAFRRPAVLELITTVNAAFETGTYVPLPTTVYPVAQVQEAFEAVARGSHVGRVVLDFGDEAPPVKPIRPSAPVLADASYLVTGGFGAFGLATARWLVAAGARHLVLVGRRGASSPAAKQQLAAFSEAGVEVDEVALDIADAVEVGVLLDRLVAGPVPLRGIFHAAGVLDDRPFGEIDSASLRTVLGPKVAGAVNLHRGSLARGIALDYFVTYSSATAITGTVPQANYAAANAVLDSLAWLRRDLGLPGLTVNWGALAGGMADSSTEVQRYLAMIGLNEVDMDLAARLLHEALALDVTHVGILDVDWSRWGATHPASATTPRFAVHVSSAGSAGSDSARLQTELLSLPEAQRLEVVAYMLADQLAVVLGMPAESVDLETALPDLGMDSLMAVEMQARVNLALAIEVSALEFSRSGGLLGLAARIMPTLTGVTEPASAGV